MRQSIRRGLACVLVLLTFLPLMTPAVLSAGGVAEAEPAGPEAAAAAFAKLGALVGDWRAKTPDGNATRVNFRLSAGDSVLVETWAMPSGRESMTLYHLDDGALIATHYCPQGNQPRLQLARIDASGRMEFAFRDGGNLGAAGAAHQHAMWLQLDTPDRLMRSETYVDNQASAAEIAAAEAGAAQVFERLSGSPAAR